MTVKDRTFSVFGIMVPFRKLELALSDAVYTIYLTSSSLAYCLCFNPVGTDLAFPNSPQPGVPQTSIERRDVFVEHLVGS